MTRNGDSSSRLVLRKLGAEGFDFGSCRMEVGGVGWGFWRIGVKPGVEFLLCFLKRCLCRLVVCERFGALLRGSKFAGA